MRLSTDERRTARLLLWDAQPDGDDIRHPDVEPAVRVRPRPSPALRAWQRRALRRGSLTYERDIVDSVVAARRAVMGAAADGPPRVLVRVDGFPMAHAHDEPGRYGTAAYEQFHSILRDAGVPYLLAVLPWIAHDCLNPQGTDGEPPRSDEMELLERLRADPGVAFALQGPDHRTRDANPRRHSALRGLDRATLATKLDEADATLLRWGLPAHVFVAPFNRFDPSQYALLAERYDVVCAGPETVALMGFHPGPQWRGEAVYLPSYAPLHARARDVNAAVCRLAERRAAVWAPVTLHPSWEIEDDFAGLRELAATLADIATPWDDFLAAVRKSR